MRFWLISTSPENFAYDRAVLKFAQQGIKDRNRRMVQKISLDHDVGFVSGIDL